MQRKYETRLAIPPQGVDVEIVGKALLLLTKEKKKKPFLTHDYEEFSLVEKMASVRILSLLLLFVVGPCTKWMLKKCIPQWLYL